MAHTYTSILVHCVFSTKERKPMIPDEIEPRLWDYMGGIVRENGFKSLRIGGTKNHIHALLSLPAAMPIPKALQLIKGGSSKWMNDHLERRTFAWQNAYGAFSIGISQIDATVHYIETQKEHHKKVTFEEEYLGFLKKHGIEYDPKYVWG